METENRKFLKRCQSIGGTEKKLEKLAKKKKTYINTEESRKLYDDGFNQGLNGRTFEEVADKLKSIPFKKGYELGVRQKEITIFQQKVKIVEEMAKENIPFEMAPDDIKNDDRLRICYTLCVNGKKIEASKAKVK